MAALGGPIKEVSIRGRLFVCDGEADGNTKLGGFENEIKPNGDGSARLLKKRVPWSIMGLKISVDRNRSDQEFFKEIADAPDYVPIDVTFVDNVTYQATGQIVGEVAYSNQDATAEINLSGPGDATQQ